MTNGPIMWKCPICHKMGRLNAFRPSGSNITKYYTGHEQLPDHKPWGTDPRHTVTPIRRCYLKKVHHIEMAKKKLSELNLINV